MYLGRVIGLVNERPFGVYAVSGRSEGSKARRFVIKDPLTVATEPLGELTAEQMEMMDLIFYNAIKVHPDRKRVVISNGSQTDHILLALCDSENPDYSLAIARGFVEAGGAEPDTYRTPRIAGIIDNGGGLALGIVTEHGLNVETLGNSDIQRRYISTYAGHLDDPRAVVVSGLEIPTGTFNLEGHTAQDLADNMYGWMDPALVVCTAAALWDPRKENWNLAVRNLHE